MLLRCAGRVVIDHLLFLKAEYIIVANLLDIFIKDLNAVSAESVMAGLPCIVPMTCKTGKVPPEHERSPHNHPKIRFQDG